MTCFVLIMKSIMTDVEFQHIVGKEPSLFILEAGPYYDHFFYEMIFYEMIIRSEKPELIKLFPFLAFNSHIFGNRLVLIPGIYELPAENRDNREDRDKITTNFKYIHFPVIHFLLHITYWPPKNVR